MSHSLHQILPHHLKISGIAWSSKHLTAATDIPAERRETAHDADLIPVASVPGLLSVHDAAEAVKQNKAGITPGLLHKHTFSSRPEQVLLRP